LDGQIKGHCAMNNCICTTLSTCLQLVF